MSETTCKHTNSPFYHDPSATGAFAALKSVKAPQVRADGEPLRAVVIGGGTGAPVSIRTLLSMGIQTDAVVAMADDGGSTGILRAEANATCPGDVRKCVTAMAADAEDPFTEAFKMRFTFAKNHTLGNLMLSALEVTSGSFPEAIRICERLLNARGHVYPSTLDRVTLVAQTCDGTHVTGQAVACHSRSTLQRVALESEKPIVAYEPALNAIRRADLVVLGPGSLFTSIITNLMVPGLVDAIRASSGTVVFVCSLADMQGETWGLTAQEHYNALCDHGMQGLIDCMLVHVSQQRQAVGADSHENSSAQQTLCDTEKTLSEEATTYGIEDDESRLVRPVSITQQDLVAIEKQGTQVFVRDLVDRMRPTWHDPQKLQAAFLEVLETCRSPQM